MKKMFYTISIFCTFLTLSSCSGFSFFIWGNPSPPSNAVDLTLPAMPDEWETLLDKSTLPTLQTNLGGSTDLEWRYANAVLGAEVWMIDDSPDSEAKNDFVVDPGLRNLPLIDTGWPKEVPDNFKITLSTYYQVPVPTIPGELRSNKPQGSLTGIYVVTWKGKTLPEAQGGTFDILDTVNDDDPLVGTQILPAGDHRVIARVRSTGRGVNVQYRKPDPSDPIRDIKIWTPLDQGLGQSLDLSVYQESVLGPGELGSYCTEPGPGVPDPLWHPKYLEHLRSDPSGVIRFMGFQNINGLTQESPLNWSDAMPSTYTLGHLVGIDPFNYDIRFPLNQFKGRCGIPYEWIVDLCNMVNKDVWIQVPHVATADHIQGLATLMAKTLKTSQRVWFEFSNEIWNNYGPYLPQYNAGVREGSAYGKSQGWGSGHLQAKALRNFENAWFKAGGSDDRLINVVAGFAVGPGYNAEVIQGVEAISASLAEVFAITTYFGMELTGKLYSLNYGTGNPGEEVYQEAKSSLRGSIYRDYEAWQANASLCREHNIGMVAYEGGSHVLATGLGDWSNPQHAAFMNFLANLHKHPVMKDLYMEHWALWCAAGGRTASLFVDIGGYGYYGYWGAKENVTEKPDDSPRWQAAQEFGQSQQLIRALGEPLGTSPKIQDLRSFRGEVGQSYTQAISASSGEGPLKIVILGGGIPSGTQFTTLGAEGTVSGIPNTLEIARYVVRVTDQDGDPDYGVFSVSVDPSGSTSGKLLLLETRSGDLPESSLEKSENREDFRTRYEATREVLKSPSSLGYQICLPFDESLPLFRQHYQDSNLLIGSTSPFAPSGGWSLDLLRDEFNSANTASDGGAAVIFDALKLDATTLWVGLRDHLFSGWIGASLELPVDATHAEPVRFGVPTIFNSLLIWRRDQLAMDSAPSTLLSFGSGGSQASLILETEGLAADKVLVRFVIKNKDGAGVFRYYLSQAAWADPSAGRFELTDFNNNPAEGKLWVEFTPSAMDFAMPDVSKLSFIPVDFNDVDAVGFGIQLYRTGWHYSMGLSRFLVVGKKSPL